MGGGWLAALASSAGSSRSARKPSNSAAHMIRPCMHVRAIENVASNCNEDDILYPTHHLSHLYANVLNDINSITYNAVTGY